MYPRWFRAALLMGTVAGNTDVLDLVGDLARLRPFTREGVARVTGKALEKNPAASNRYFTVFRSRAAGKGALASVELRLPQPGASARDGLVVLSLSGNPCIDQAAVMASFGGQPEVAVPEPAAPYELSLVYQRPWGRLHFSFARRSRCLIQVTLDATEPLPVK